MNGIVPGGKKVDYRNPANVAKIRKLEEDAERLRQEIAEKERAARKLVQEWDRLDTDVARADTRAELVRENLQSLESMDVSFPDEHDPHDEMAQVVAEGNEV